MDINKSAIISEIKPFLDGVNDDLKYIVHVETNPNNNIAECIVHPPNSEKEIVKIPYTPFLYTKDLKANGIELYNGNTQLEESKRRMYGVEVTKLKTGGQKRLKDGFCYKYSSTKSFNSIIDFFKDGGVDPYMKVEGEDGKPLKDNRGYAVMPNRKYFYSVKYFEQFLIDKKARLYKGFEEYKDIHRVIFDIETTGLRSEISRIFSIGVKDNRGLDIILEVDKTNSDEAEIDLIRDFFNLVTYLEPAVIAGFNSEEFDFNFLIERLKILGVDINKLKTTLKDNVKIKRKANSSVKIGGNADKYTATIMWGIPVVDILHAVRRAAAINSDLKQTNLKYIARESDVAKENRTYIKGEDNDIGRFYHENKVFTCNDQNEFLEIPDEFQEISERLFKLQENKEKVGEKYNEYKKKILKTNPDFVKWFRGEPLEKNMKMFVRGRVLVNQYLSDDLQETIDVDEIYNQSSFMLTKIVPTTYPRICTMGTASVWNLLLTAWSYDNDLAIPQPDVFDKDIPGGLSRCYKKGYIKRLVKIDYASLYPMLQLTHDIFPIFDISGVMKKMLVYMTTTRNIYKKLGKSTPLNDEEVELIKAIDHEVYMRYLDDKLTKKDRDMFNIKQLPIKILNNSQFGALGSNIAFNWSDNVCAGRITCCGRIELRHATNWFSKFNCIPLYAVTDGVNFHIPDYTHIIVNENGIDDSPKDEAPIEEMWKYGGEVGINALIEYFNDHEMRKPFMAVDNDGEFLSCYNLARINYAVLEEKEDKKTGKKKKKIKYTGNTIKSSVLPEYIEEFMDKGFALILEGKGYEFVQYYYDYVERIFYKQIPLKKIASKSKYKHTLKQYSNRGKDKNGRDKAKQAHMELIIREREKIAEELFNKHKENLDLPKEEDKLTIKDKLKLIDVYMPPEPELDSTIYYYNNGYRKSHGDSKEIKDKDTGEKRFASTLISKEDLIENPDMKGDYNVEKYLAAFNSRVESMFLAFDPEISIKIPAKIERKKEKDINGKKKEVISLKKEQFKRSDLNLKSFDLDDLEESYYLEPKEVKFWNKTGYDPRLVWNGFKVSEDNKIHYEIYENALNFVNEKMKESGKGFVKSINDKLNKNDFILIKDDYKYHLGIYNGTFIKILKEDIDIPKSDYEKKMEEETKKEEEKLEKLKELENKSNEEFKLEEKNKKRIKFYPFFAKKFNISISEYSDFRDAYSKEGIAMLDQFIKDEEEREIDEVQEYIGGDYEP